MEDADRATIVFADMRNSTIALRICEWSFFLLLVEWQEVRDKRHDDRVLRPGKPSS
jgi:hypothetical protein